MLKNTFWSKSVCLLTAYAVAFAAIPRYAHAWGLAPESFDRMYQLAQQGNVEALRASVYRGLNIDSVNRDGDSGLCVAAKRRDAYTYNAFRAAGANPHHPCVQRIKGYESFVENSQAVPVTATARAAYGAMGKETYAVSSRLWWGLGALLLAGGVVALVAGHGGGGGKGGSDSPQESYNSLGTNAATDGKAKVLNLTKGPSTNSRNITHTSTNLTEIASVNLTTDAMKNTQFMDVILKADNGGIYTNQTNTLLQVGAGVIGMDAVNSSSVINSGYINVNSFNASVGMVAGKKSLAVNNGKGIIDGSSTNGIDLNFSGFKDTFSIVGMYADTNSTIENKGDIKGTAIQRATLSGNTNEDTVSGYTGLVSDFFDTQDNNDDASTASTGTIIGMEAMLLNVGQDLNTHTITVKNADDGTIKLIAGDQGSTETEIKVSLIGMGSYIDDGFLNGSLNLKRTENVVLDNTGKIDLQYTGNYTAPSETAFKNGLAGIVGIRADANTKAYNSGNILITLEGEESSESGETTGGDLSAGMQSVHGGYLTNQENGTIKIIAPESSTRINYGMISTKGSGTVSTLFSDYNQKLLNEGSIVLQASNGFGMASFNGGTVQNSGIITLGIATGDSDTNNYKYNTGLYGYGNSKQATLSNTGTINIYSASSVAMQNDFSGDTKLENQGTINVYRNARNTLVFGGAYSELHNSGQINYYATPGSTSPNTVGSDVDVFADYTPKANIAVMSTKARTLEDLKNSESGSETTTATTETIYNDMDGVINVSGTSSVAAMAVETDQGRAFNKGIINVTVGTYPTSTDSLGMYLSSVTDSEAQIINQGQINTNEINSAAMASDSTAGAVMINDVGAIIRTAVQNSLGMFASGKSNIQNGGTIELGKDNSTAIYTRGSSTITNTATGTVSVGSLTNSIQKGFGIYAGENAESDITNNGTINLWTSEIGGGIYALGKANIINNKNINVYTSDAYGIYISGAANITNGVDAVIKVGDESKAVKNSYAVYSAGDYKIITNAGTIDFYNNSDYVGYAIYAASSSTAESSEAQIINSGKINLYNENSTAIYAELGTITNASAYALNILNNKNTAFTISKGANVVNNTDSVINIGSNETPVSESYGLNSTDTATGKMTNNGIINLYAANADSYAVYAKNTVNVENNQTINSYKDYSTAIYSTGQNSIVNNGAINVNGNNIFGIKATGADSVLNVTNAKNATINIGRDDVVSYGSAISAEAVGTISNLGSITVDNRYGYGIFAQTGTKIENGNETTKGTISMTNTDATAISSGAVSEVLNTGTINLAGSNSTGILATSGSSLKSSGSIIAEAVNSTAISSGSVTAVENSGKIEMRAADSTGIEASSDSSASGASITNTADGSIIMQKANSIAINSGAAGTVTNSGTISLKEGNSKGIYSLSTGAVNVTNNKTIDLLNGNSSYGIFMASSSSTITNNKDATISVGTGSDEINSYAVNIDSGSVTNQGNIYLNSQGTAIYVKSEGSVTNGQAGTSGQQGFIQTNRANSTVIDLDGGTLTNYGKINAIGNNSKAVNLQSSSTVINNNAAKISVSGSDSYAIYSAGAATITNDGTIEAVKDKPAWSGTTLIDTAEGSTVTNNLYLTAGENSVAIKTEHTSTINTGINSRIKLGDNSSGIVAGLQNDITNLGRITVGSGGDNYVYAIKAGSLSSVINSGILTVGDNGAGIWVDDQGEITNSGGGITVGDGTTKYVYGIRAGANSTVTNSAPITVGENGTAIWVGNNGTVENHGNLTVGDGSSSERRSYGIFSTSNGTITNYGNITIGKNAQGIYAKSPKSVENYGDILVKGTSSIGINIYLPYDSSEGTTISNSGDITVNNPGEGTYAIYLSKGYIYEPEEQQTPKTDSEGNPMTDEDGNIIYETTYKGDNLSYGSMNWSDLTINCAGGLPCTDENVNKDENDAYNREQIHDPNKTYTPSDNNFDDVDINTEDNGGSSYSPTSLIGASSRGLLSSVRLLNTGNIITPNSDIDFGSGSEDNAQIAVGLGGRYQANSFTGTVYADSSIVQNGFEDTYVNENSFDGQDNGLEVVSESYMFNASKQANNNGGTDVVMTLKPFSETIDNPQMAAYLAQNYAAQRGEGIFNTLKRAGNQAQYAQYLSREFGFNIIPNLAKQSLDMEQTLGRTVNDELLTPTDNDFRSIAGIINYAQDVDDKGVVSGYDNDVTAVYSTADWKIDNSWRAGLGLEIARSQGDYDAGGSHYNNFLEVYAPVIFSQDNLSVLLKPKAGFARGHYRREAVDSLHKADVDQYYYGIDAEARQNIDLDVVEVEPNAGVNVTGLYIDDIDESNNGLKIKDKNVVSAQTYVGADVKKKFEINDNHSVSALVGGKYYHEFGQKYRTKASAADMVGTYEIVSNRLQRNFGLITAKARYDYRQFSISASVNAPLKQDDNVYYLFNLGYGF